MKILISGAGIAGNALAHFLLQQGHTVTLLERHPSLRKTGLQIDLRGHGVTVLKRMGLEPAFRACAVSEQGLAVVNSTGKRVAWFPANTSGKGVQSFTSEYEIMRGDLAALFFDQLQGADVRFGTSITSYAESASGVSVTLSTGATETYDLLLGADGQNSRTRRLMLGPDTPDAFKQIPGSYAAYFHAPRPASEGEAFAATMYTATGRRGIMVRRADKSRIQVYLGCTTTSTTLQRAREAGDVPAQKRELARIFEGAGWESDALVAAMMAADDFYLERMGLVKMQAWHRGRVALVGDAGYCPSANTGMGTTSALVGAYILAGEIGKHCGRSGAAGTADKASVQAALAAYDAKFRPFMAQVQAGVAEGTSGFERLANTGWGIAVQNRMLGLAALFRVNIFDWFLKETVKDWELPEYAI